MRTVKIVIAIWVLAAVVATLFGDISVAGELGSNTANFLKIGVGARALGMGCAFTSIADNPSAVYWNAAGLRRLTSSQAEFSHQSWYQDVTVENLQIAFPGDKVSFGAGITYVNLGSIRSYDELGNQSDEITLYNMAFTVAAAADITDNVAIGVSAKYIEQSFDIVKGDAVAADVGILASSHGINFGAAVTNMGTDITYFNVSEPLPAAVRTGVSFRQFEDKALFSIEAYTPFRGTPAIHQGLEINLIQDLYARSGLIYQTGAVSGTNAVSYDLGLGVAYGRGRFDYTFIPSDDYGSDAVHNFSISLSW